MPHKKLPVKNFAKFASLISQPNLNEVQLVSYRDFVTRGLKELLEEASPILDHTGKELALYFDDFYFGEPKYDEVTTRYKDATYEMPLHLKVRLDNKKTGATHAQEVYFGEFPKQADAVFPGRRRPRRLDKRKLLHDEAPRRPHDLPHP